MTKYKIYVNDMTSDSEISNQKNSSTKNQIQTANSKNLVKLKNHSFFSKSKNVNIKSGFFLPIKRNLLGPKNLLILFLD